MNNGHDETLMINDSPLTNMTAEIANMADEASRTCGLSFDVYVQQFSRMVDANYAKSSPEIRAAAIEIALQHDYCSPDEIKELHRELSSSGYCSHGLDRDTCPCGCFET